MDLNLLDDSTIYGDSTNELIIFSKIFDLNPTVNYFKVELTASVINSTNMIIGRTSIILYKNRLPTGGNCDVDQNNGTSLSTYFNINCTNWYDIDGPIDKYIYYGNNNLITITYN